MEPSRVKMKFTVILFLVVYARAAPRTTRDVYETTTSDPSETTSHIELTTISDITLNAVDSPNKLLSDVDLDSLETNSSNSDVPINAIKSSANIIDLNGGDKYSIGFNMPDSTELRYLRIIPIQKSISNDDAPSSTQIIETSTFNSVTTQFPLSVTDISNTTVIVDSSELLGLTERNPVTSTVKSIETTTVSEEITENVPIQFINIIPTAKKVNKAISFNEDSRIINIITTVRPVVQFTTEFNEIEESSTITTTTAAIPTTTGAIPTTTDGNSSREKVRGNARFKIRTKGNSSASDQENYPDLDSFKKRVEEVNELKRFQSHVIPQPTTLPPIIRQLLNELSEMKKKNADFDKNKPDESAENSAGNSITSRRPGLIYTTIERNQPKIEATTQISSENINGANKEFYEKSANKSSDRSKNYSIINRTNPNRITLEQTTFSPSITRLSPYTNSAYRSLKKEPERISTTARSHDVKSTIVENLKKENTNNSTRTFLQTVKTAEDTRSNDLKPKTPSFRGRQKYVPSKFETISPFISDSHVRQLFPGKDNITVRRPVIDKDRGNLRFKNLTAQIELDPAKSDSKSFKNRYEIAVSTTGDGSVDGNSADLAGHKLSGSSSASAASSKINYNGARHEAHSNSNYDSDTANKQEQISNGPTSFSLGQSGRGNRFRSRPSSGSSGIKSGSITGKDTIKSNSISGSEESTQSGLTGDSVVLVGFNNQNSGSNTGKDKFRPSGSGSSNSGSESAQNSGSLRDSSGLRQSSSGSGAGFGLSGNSATDSGRFASQNSGLTGKDTRPSTGFGSSSPGSGVGFGLSGNSASNSGSAGKDTLKSSTGFGQSSSGSGSDGEFGLSGNSATNSGGFSGQNSGLTGKDTARPATGFGLSNSGSGIGSSNSGSGVGFGLSGNSAGNFGSTGKDTSRPSTGFGSSNSGSGIGFGLSGNSATISGSTGKDALRSSTGFGSSNSGSDVGFGLFGNSAGNSGSTGKDTSRPSAGFGSSNLGTGIEESDQNSGSGSSASKSTGFNGQNSGSITGKATSKPSFGSETSNSGSGIEESVQSTGFGLSGSLGTKSTGFNGQNSGSKPTFGFGASNSGSGIGESAQTTGFGLLGSSGTKSTGFNSQNSVSGIEESTQTTGFGLSGSAGKSTGFGQNSGSTGTASFKPTSGFGSSNSGSTTGFGSNTPSANKSLLFGQTTSPNGGFGLIHLGGSGSVKDSETKFVLGKQIKVENIGLKLAETGTGLTGNDKRYKHVGVQSLINGILTNQFDSSEEDKRVVYRSTTPKSVQIGGGKIGGSYRVQSSDSSSPKPNFSLNPEGLDADKLTKYPQLYKTFGQGEIKPDGERGGKNIGNINPNNHGLTSPTKTPVLRNTAKHREPSSYINNEIDDRGNKYRGSVKFKWDPQNPEWIYDDDDSDFPSQFSYNYQTANGISASQKGVLKAVDNRKVFVITGSYQYTSPDGTPIHVKYTADEHGFHPIITTPLELTPLEKYDFDVEAFQSEDYYT